MRKKVVSSIKKRVISILAYVLCLGVATTSVTCFTPSVVEASDGTTINEVARAGKQVATCTIDKSKCVIDVESDNPYDVEWDYGDRWNTYVQMCDWSLVFDAEFYKETFPMLALQYGYDDELLLKHFQTVGVHEGRQGCKDFNIYAYLKNNVRLYNAYIDKVECGYIYYMLNYRIESETNTVSCNDGTEAPIQLSTILTAIQQDELDKINEYREQAGVDPVEANSEFMALANYRAYINRVCGYGMNNEGHTWARTHKDEYLGYIDIVAKRHEGYTLLENTVTSKTNGYRNNYAQLYYGCKSHREAMLDERDKITGISNSYVTPSTYTASQYDLFLVY